MNIIRNFLPRETITYNGKDPTWMNKKIKTLFAKEMLCINA